LSYRKIWSKKTSLTKLQQQRFSTRKNSSSRFTNRINGFFARLKNKIPLALPLLNGRDG
jgi:hypothetical protein